MLLDAKNSYLETSKKHTGNKTDIYSSRFLLARRFVEKRSHSQGILLQSKLIKVE
jgi:hypothetical protein